jgi:raffinose/stachyose/melibiose transport system substrate-binding protein
MGRERRHGVVSLCGAVVIASAVLMAFGWVAARRTAAVAWQGQTLRIGHQLLQAGHREAWAEIAEHYRRIRPDVRVEQVSIPPRVWPAWVKPQMIGATAPDILQVHQIEDDLLVRYFLVLSDEVDLPNPYNAGTDLAATKWRDTFVDGISGRPNYSNNLGEVFGVPTHLNVNRLVVNRDLLWRYAGRRDPPRSFGEFVAACEMILERAAAEGVVVVPVAAAGPNAPILHRYFETQTQRLRRRIDTEKQIVPWSLEELINVGLGRVTIDTPEVVSGLELMREMGRFLPAGFEQLTGADALFLFVQQRAVFFVVGSVDYPTVRGQIAFETAIIPLPMPDSGDPRWGRFMLGEVADPDIASQPGYGVSRASANRELALDFLRFATSRAMNERLVARTGWLPAVVGATLPEVAVGFSPRSGGYVPGFNLGLGWEQHGGLGVLLGMNAHLLTGRNASVDAYRNAMREEWPVRALAAARSRMRQNVATMGTQDGVYLARMVRVMRGGGDPERERAWFSLHHDSQTENELTQLWFEYLLRAEGLVP